MSDDENNCSDSENNDQTDVIVTQLSRSTRYPYHFVSYFFSLLICYLITFPKDSQSSSASQVNADNQIPVINHAFQLLNQSPMPTKKLSDYQFLRNNIKQISDNSNTILLPATCERSKD